MSTAALRVSVFWKVKDEKDMSNYENIPDSTELPPAVPASADPCAGASVIPKSSRGMACVLTLLARLQKSAFEPPKSF